MRRGRDDKNRRGKINEREGEEGRGRDINREEGKGKEKDRKGKIGKGTKWKRKIMEKVKIVDLKECKNREKCKN